MSFASFSAFKKYLQHLRLYVLLPHRIESKLICSLFNRRKVLFVSKKEGEKEKCVFEESF